MEHIVTAIIAAIPSSALPLLVCILGCCFIYLKIRERQKADKDRTR